MWTPGPGGAPLSSRALCAGSHLHDTPGFLSCPSGRPPQDRSWLTSLPIFAGKTLPSWGQTLLSQDFELLCRDGSRADVTEWRRCHLARVPAHAVVVRADTDGGLIFRLLNEGQVRRGTTPLKAFPTGAGPSYLPQHGREDSWPDGDTGSLRHPSEKVPHACASED